MSNFLRKLDNTNFRTKADANVVHGILEVLEICICISEDVEVKNSYTLD